MAPERAIDEPMSRRTREPNILFVRREKTVGTRIGSKLPRRLKPWLRRIGYRDASFDELSVRSSRRRSVASQRRDRNESAHRAPPCDSEELVEGTLRASTVLEIGARGLVVSGERFGGYRKRYKNEIGVRADRLTLTGARNSGAATACGLA